MKFTLYHYWRSSASWRVRYALEIKKISYISQPIDLLKQEEKKTEYLKISPSGYVPCLVVDDKPLFESLAIIEWLEENYPEPSLLRGDSFQRAKIRQFAETVNSGIQPLINLDVLKKFSTDPVAQVTWSQHWIERGLQICETLLSEQGNKNGFYTFGDEPTLADVCLIPQCFSALRNKVNLEKFPKVYKVYEFAKKSETFQKSCPEQFQPGEN